MKSLLTGAFWTVSLACLILGGTLATIFVFMPVSLDPTEMITDGVEPWRDAAIAIGAFIALVVATGVSLRLWHTARFKLLALILAAGEIAAVSWSSFLVYNDYF